MNAAWTARNIQCAGIRYDDTTPELYVTTVGSLAVVHTREYRIAAVAVVTAAGAPRVVSRVDDPDPKRKSYSKRRKATSA
ncbi:MAG: hypothetical protein IPJ61_19220 [Tessaracoccus sp.]|uniref:hypothetical protein n=1 Tax=Tessaracoccus sp. TaxID=1971211 RepID=UPI001EBB09DA|nr:hypothetical protein [Tessaracoccus sp.]MBK7823119.1 hypothetical protein [Tessaracoccus sp.]